MLISEGQRPTKPRKSHKAEYSEFNDHDEPNQKNILCAALIETKLIGDDQEAKILLKSHQLQHARKYKVEIAVGAKEL